MSVKQTFFLAILLIILSLIVVESGGTKFASSEENEDRSGHDQTTNTNKADYVNEDFENELRTKKAEALKLKQLREKKKLGATAVRRTIQANSSDQCELSTHPLRVVQGKLCGSHYKVLQLDRFNDQIDKNAVKKAYRQLSLAVHPDKNPADDAASAFKIIQDAYECLSDESCKRDYDYRLTAEEERIQWERMQMKERIAEKAIEGLRYTHQYATKTSNVVLAACRKIWDWAGDLTLPWYDSELPLGRIIMSMLVISQFKVTFPVIGFAILVAKLNEEFLKTQRHHYYDNRYYAF